MDAYLSAIERQISTELGPDIKISASRDPRTNNVRIRYGPALLVEIAKNTVLEMFDEPDDPLAAAYILIACTFSGNRLPDKPSMNETGRFICRDIAARHPSRRRTHVSIDPRRLIQAAQSGIAAAANRG